MPAATFLWARHSGKRGEWPVRDRLCQRPACRDEPSCAGRSQCSAALLCEINYRGLPDAASARNWQGSAKGSFSEPGFLAAGVRLGGEDVGFYIPPIGSMPVAPIRLRMLMVGGGLTTCQKAVVSQRCETIPPSPPSPPNPRPPTMPSSELLSPLPPAPLAGYAPPPPSPPTPPGGYVPPEPLPPAPPGGYSPPPPLPPAPVAGYAPPSPPSPPPSPPLLPPPPPPPLPSNTVPQSPLAPPSQPSGSIATSVDAQSGSLVLDLVMTILPAGGGTVLLLLFGYYLWRRLHRKTRKQGDVHGVTEVEDAEDAADLEAQPCAELALESRPVALDGFVESMPRAPSIQDSVKASRLSPRAPRPKSLPHAESQSGRRMLSRMLSAEASKEVAEARDRARYPTEPSNSGPATTDRSQQTDLIAPSLPYRLMLWFRRRYRPQSIGSRSEVIARSRSPKRWKRWKRTGRCALAAPGPPLKRPRLSSTRCTWVPRAAKTGPVAPRPEGHSDRGRLRARERPSTCSQGCARGAPQPHKRPKPYKRPTPCAGCHPGGSSQYACENAQRVHARGAKRLVT